jgi:hypothetical protein
MGKDVVNGGLEPFVAPGERLMVRIFAGSLALGHLAPPDEATVPAEVAREICRHAATVLRMEEWRPCLPPVWRDWFDTIPGPARVAVWRGCAALHLYAVVGRP